VQANLTIAGGAVDRQDSSNDGESWILTVFGGPNVPACAGGGVLILRQRMRGR
jgi:hypothetical protein